MFDRYQNNKKFIFVIALAWTIVSIYAQNCAFAPNCPDIITWKAGFICNDNYIPTIKTRFIDGVRKKTVCCKELSKCRQQQFWCDPVNSTIFKENFARNKTEVRPNCTPGCVPKWKSFDVNDSHSIYLVRAGSYTPGISTFIGRTMINGDFQIGRIQISHPVGIFYTFDGSVQFSNTSVEYLVDDGYTWVPSSHGSIVKNAVTVSALKNLPFYIGRIKINGFTFIGTVVRVLGLLYYGDENGMERSTDCYEVLVCGSKNGPNFSGIGNLDSRPQVPQNFSVASFNLNLESKPQIINGWNQMSNSTGIGINGDFLGSQMESTTSLNYFNSTKNPPFASQNGDQYLNLEANPQIQQNSSNILQLSLHSDPHNVVNLNTHLSTTEFSTSTESDAIWTGIVGGISYSTPNIQILTDKITSILSDDEFTTRKSSTLALHDYISYENHAVHNESHYTATSNPVANNQSTDNSSFITETVTSDSMIMEITDKVETEFSSTFVQSPTDPSTTEQIMHVFQNSQVTSFPNHIYSSSSDATDAHSYQSADSPLNPSSFSFNEVTTTKHPQSSDNSGNATTNEQSFVINSVVDQDGNNGNSDLNESVMESSTNFQGITEYTTLKHTSTTSSKYTKPLTTKKTQNSSAAWLFTTARTTSSTAEDFSSGSGAIEENNNIEPISTFECVPHWKLLSTKSSFLFDGISITSPSPDSLSYVGQIKVNGSFVPGRIDLQPQKPSEFSFQLNNILEISSKNPVIYLSKTQLQNYSWQISSKGAAVQNAIAINQAGKWPFYIGRINSSGVTLIGKVLPSNGLVFVDKYGNERITKVYEVLTCQSMVDEKTSGNCGI